MRAGPAPLRTCVGCRTRSGAGRLVRVARAEDGSLVVSRVAPGRGAWLCRDLRTGGPEVGCLEAAERRNAFSRAFRSEVPAGATALLRASQPERENMEVQEQQPRRD
ncbi:MAG: YlxR family protein [Actinomycetota bacterium]|nr:YlxR family protein [Actinomycetota bacterium]